MLRPKWGKGPASWAPCWTWCNVGGACAASKERRVGRETLLRVAEAARWAPTGANSQCWGLVIIGEPAARQATLDVFLRQSQ